MISTWDLVIVFVLWVIALKLLAPLGHWTRLAIALLQGFVAGSVSEFVRQMLNSEVQTAPEPGMPAHTAEDGGAIATNPFRRAWQRWGDFAARMGNFQGRLLMGLFYFAIVTLFALAQRLRGDSLSIKTIPKKSNWLPKENVGTTLREAQEQG